MGKRGKAIGMTLCALLAVAAQMYSEEVNSLFEIEINDSETHKSQLVGLQTDETWLVVLVDFESNPLSSEWIEDTQNQLKVYSDDYLSQAVGEEVDVTIDVYETILRAPQPLASYGADGSNGRDYGDGTEFLPATLAEFAVKSLQKTTYESYDLNQDGTVDRFLILHSTLAQEQGSGSSNRIWSHFTSFSEPLEKGDYVFEHYTMSSMRHGMNGIGTILHELMHQFGAFDLYPIHDSGYSGSWKGIGVWDIMASGNWNAGGDSPSLPTGPTMETIGHGPTHDLILDWPTSSNAPCIGPSIDLNARSDGGERIRVEIGQNEFLWIEKRTQQGFDQSLPGQGVLVLLEDKDAGDTAHNAMNIDQRRPYLQTIEADGGQEQLKGIDDGVASDLFQPGDEFGERGILIRDHDGILVPWYARIVQNQGQWKIEFHSEMCTPDVDIDLANFGYTLLQGESLPIQISNIGDNVQCWGELNGTDGRTLLFQNATSYNPTLYGEFSSEGMLESTATFSGTIQCNNDAFDIKTTVTTLGTIPLPERMTVKETINVDKPTELLIPYFGTGSESGEFSIHIEGPLSRITAPEQSVQIKQGEGTIQLLIEPNGLLSNNMYVLGTLHLESFNGERWDVDVELKAMDDDDTPILGNRANTLSLFFGLFALWFLASIFSNSPVQNDQEHDSHYSVEEFFPGNQR